MRTPHPKARLTARTPGSGWRACSSPVSPPSPGPTLASAHRRRHVHVRHADVWRRLAQRHRRRHRTDGCTEKTYNFHYTEEFFCKEPPSSAADSRCELGADYDADPRGGVRPAVRHRSDRVHPAGTQHAAVPDRPANCVDHPNRIDLSRVFGSGTGNSLLPPHSHIVTTEAGNTAEWWNVDVIGVKSKAAWHRIAGGKELPAHPGTASAGNPDVTDNIPTNLFLFFAVQDKHR